MSVQNQIDRINSEVSGQTALIQQIKAALEDKAAGGGTEDLNEVLTEQEALIAQLQDTLKGKAAGGGASVETYTGTINGNTGLGDIPDAVYLYTDESMTIRAVALGRNESAEITIAAGTAIINSSEFYANTFTEDELINIFTESTGRGYFFLIPAADGFVF